MTEVLKIRRFNSADADFKAKLDALLAWESVSDGAVNETVQHIIARVRAEGDQAVMALTNQHDHTQFNDPAQMQLSRDDLQAAWLRLNPELQDALTVAVDRVRSFHQRQCQTGWTYTDEIGAELGQKITPMDRVGVYVPGGSAPLASSVVMAAVTAKVAGVPEVIMAHPTPHGEVSDFVLGAAWLSGVDKAFLMGGAQAIAALAYGTEQVPPVDKIVGPGNIYVATAKRAVFGQVGIDMIAGPSEVLVVSDGHSRPDWVAMDLFSQAEHDPQAQALLISPDATFIEAVAAEMSRLLPTLERADIIRASLADRGALIQVPDMAAAIELTNRIAPEHLELCTENPKQYLDDIRHAGAIFVGRYTSEALGDYVAGPNHVLPTSGTARFSSPLGVYDFQKKTSVIHCSAEAASKLAQAASPLARGELLTAHARSAELRIMDGS